MEAGEGSPLSAAPPSPAGTHVRNPKDEESKSPEVPAALTPLTNSIPSPSGTSIRSSNSEETSPSVRPGILVLPREPYRNGGADWGIISRGGRERIGTGTSSGAASGRAMDFDLELKATRKDALSPVARMLHMASTAGGYTRFSDNATAASKEVYCNVVIAGTGLPLASLVEEAIEEALGGGAGPPDGFQKLFEGNHRRLFRGVWEATYLLVVGSLIFALWAYEGSSPNVTDLITVVVSAAGSLGVVARAFSARSYLGVIYGGHVGSGIVNLSPVSTSDLCRGMTLGSAMTDCALLVMALPFLLLYAIRSVAKVVRFVVYLVVGSEDNGSWVLGTGVLRYRDWVIAVPFMEKRVMGFDRSRTGSIQWPGGAWRAYFGRPVKGSWALHFSSRDSFLAGLCCERISLHFGTERRLIVEAGSRTLSFAIATRDSRGGLLLIPVETSGGVRVRIGVPAFCGATGGVTILMAVDYPKREPIPEEEVAKALNLKADPFCLDVSACGIGVYGKTGTEMFDVLDGAGVGAVSDRCPLWHDLPRVCFKSAAASWAAGFFGGHFETLHEYGEDGKVTTHAGPGTGDRCVTLTPSQDGPALNLEFDVVLGVRTHGRGMMKVPVNQTESTTLFSTPPKYRLIQSEGIRGKYCLIPGGDPAKWEHTITWRATLSPRKKTHVEDCEECLVT